MTDGTLNFLEANNSFSEDSDNLIIKREQEIPQWFLDDLRDEKLNSTSKREGEFMHVACIPEIVQLELLRRYNFDILVEPVRETLKMLDKLKLDLFITTRKRV